MSTPRPERAPRSRRLRWAWWSLAWAALGLGLVGIVVPGLPTVPFVLLSAYAAARGSERLHARLLADARFGPTIRDWQAGGTVARRAKQAGLAGMGGSALLLAVFAPPWASAAGIVVMGGVALWLWRRPEPLQDSDFS